MNFNTMPNAFPASVCMHYYNYCLYNVTENQKI